LGTKLKTGALSLFVSTKGWYISVISLEGSGKLFFRIFTENDKIWIKELGLCSLMPLSTIFQ
jgi:hypothetical protein